MQIRLNFGGTLNSNGCANIHQNPFNTIYFFTCLIDKTLKLRNGLRTNAPGGTCDRPTPFPQAKTTQGMQYRPCSTTENPSTFLYCTSQSLCGYL